MPWTFTHLSGELVAPDGKLASRGYSGMGEGKNNPFYQYAKGMGPIPVGKYTIGAPRDSEKVGPYALPLEPMKGTVTKGRGDFMIHGDNKDHTASKGCVIVPRKVREAVWKSGDRTLIVI